MKIFDLILETFSQKLPFVAYRAPHEQELSFISQESDDLHVFSNFESSGFLMAPFDNQEDSYLIHPDVYKKEKIQDFDLKTTIHQAFNTSELERNTYIDLVKNAIKNITAQQAQKIVISRKETLSLQDFDLIMVLKKMLSSYKNAFVYVWYHPKIGMWMGATPETLIQMKDHHFKTMSLAGTQPYRGTLKDIYWGDKEIEEQQMVSDYIQNYLKDCVEDLNFDETETIKAGNLLHLRTKISGSIQYRENIQLLVELLHPTPAVCGLPKDNSKKFILKNENYPRKFYTGYLGEVNINQETNLFVNLRCFSIKKKTATIYIGGGVTKKSNPEMEWEETVSKSQTIKSVLF